MPDANLDVPGTVAPSDEIVAVLVQTILLDVLELRVKEVSQYNLLCRLVQHAS
jgi:hypothetical protein